jgi:hypothetical protein
MALQNFLIFFFVIVFWLDHLKCVFVNRELFPFDGWHRSHYTTEYSHTNLMCGVLGYSCGRLSRLVRKYCICVKFEVFVPMHMNIILFWSSGRYLLTIMRHMLRPSTGQKSKVGYGMSGIHTSWVTQYLIYTNLTLCTFSLKTHNKLSKIN